ncbi:ommochrome-binding protein [Amyelois transitella]|uniref:ommochrome-binding protein n=1 Tax=Amyelois transitella TaxID=680683 RepID=UPI0029907013|nr:ommochrome-binding protein [Amyelois transitella]
MAPQINDSILAFYLTKRTLSYRAIMATKFNTRNQYYQTHVMKYEPIITTYGLSANMKRRPVHVSGLHVRDMNLFLILYSVIAVVVAKHTSDHKCDGFLVHGKCHKAEVLTNGLNRPYQLSYSNSTDRLYFSYNVGFQNTSTFEIGYIDIGKHQKIPTPVNVTNGFATAIDHKNDIIYFGGSEGIFMDNLTDSKDIHPVHLKFDVWDLFYRHHLYFIRYPTMRLYKISKGPRLQKHIHEKIYQFVIDKDEDIFITNKTGLFMIKNGTNERILFKGAQIFRAIEINHEGNAYFCGQNEIYVANKHHHILEKIADKKDIFGLTFDSENNIIFSDPDQIVRLTPEDK